MKGLVAICLMGFITYSAIAQDSRMFTFQGTVYDESTEKPLEAFLVDVYEGNNIISSPEVGKKGKFEADLFGSGKYIIDISLDGYYPKRVVVNTNVPDDVKKAPAFKFEVQLIRKSDYELIEKVDIFSTSIFDFPYVMFEWNKSIEDWDYRKAYTEHIKEEYAKVGDFR